MFSNTAFEAMYQYLGLELHSKFIEVITSQQVFLGLIVLIFGGLFLLTTLQFFSRYIPGVLVARKHVPLSKYARIVALLFLAISILRVGSATGVKRFNGESWHQNPYVHGQLKQVSPQYRVSFLFDLMSRTAEEISAFMARVIDNLFQTSHSQLDAPNFFFKALMYGAASTIEDQDLKRSIRYYTDECFDRMLPLIGDLKKEKKLDEFFTWSTNSRIDDRLSELSIETRDRTPYNCLELKNDVRERLQQYGMGRAGFVQMLTSAPWVLKQFSVTAAQNYYTSNLLISQFHGEQEALLGVQKGSQLPTTGGRITQYLHRIGFDGLISFVMGGNYSGAWVAGERAQEFSENLARAPHVAGFIKMMLIAAFPWLLFAVVAGYWRVLIYWWLMYFSVLLWTPIWTLLYHVVTSIALSAELMEAFGKLNDGVSMYAAQIVSSRIYHLFAVYAWLQLLTGTVFTGMLMYFVKPALGDTEADSTPDTGVTSVISAVAPGGGAFASSARGAH